MQSSPVFLQITKTGALYRLDLGLIQPLSILSLMACFTARSSSSYILYSLGQGDGAVGSIKSIL